MYNSLDWKLEPEGQASILPFCAPRESLFITNKNHFGSTFGSLGLLSVRLQKWVLFVKWHD